MVETNYSAVRTSHRLHLIQSQPLHHSVKMSVIQEMLLNLINMDVSGFCMKKLTFRIKSPLLLQMCDIWKVFDQGVVIHGVSVCHKYNDHDVTFRHRHPQRSDRFDRYYLSFYFTKWVTFTMTSFFLSFISELQK